MNKVEISKFIVEKVTEYDVKIKILLIVSSENSLCKQQRKIAHLN